MTEGTAGGTKVEQQGRGYDYAVGNISGCFEGAMINHCSIGKQEMDLDRVLASVNCHVTVTRRKQASERHLTKGQIADQGPAHHIPSCVL